MVTFGVHSDKDSVHSRRDILQEKPLHKALYSNNGPISKIGNAELLRKTTKGFVYEQFINGQARQTETLPRPVLQPMLEILLSKPQVARVCASAIHNQFAKKNGSSFKTEFLEFLTKKLSHNSVLRFIKGRGMGYWEDDARYNGPYTAIIKFMEKSEMLDMTGIFDKTKGQINAMSEWNAQFNAQESTIPLLDSFDLIKSIESRVVKK